MTIGELCRTMITRLETVSHDDILSLLTVFFSPRLEWFDTRFPRIAVNVEVSIAPTAEVS